MEQRISDFFKFKWEKDKNQYTASENDKLIMNQLPQEVKIHLLRNFLYKDFLVQFRRFFRFKKQRNIMTEFSMEYVDRGNVDT